MLNELMVKPMPDDWNVVVSWMAAFIVTVAGLFGPL
jgi:hypothetical protein